MYAGPGAERPLCYVGLTAPPGTPTGTMSQLTRPSVVLRQIEEHIWNQRDEPSTVVPLSLKSDQNCASWVCPREHMCMARVVQQGQERKDGKRER